jgi:hypothetical protein
MNEWAELHGESPSDFDPEPEPEPNGEWICARCGRKHRTCLKPGVYDYEYCVIDRCRMIWRPDTTSVDAIYCRNCEAWVERKDLVRWTGDDALHYLCNGCDDDLLPVQKMED